MATPSSQRGLTPGLKTLLLVVGALLALIIVLIWSFIIDRGRSFADVTTEQTVVANDETNIDTTDNGAAAALEESRSIVADMAKTPLCGDVDKTVTNLSTFVQRAEAIGSLTDDDSQLVSDVLDRTNSACEKTEAAELETALEGPGIPSTLASINLDDWLTPARPASENAQVVNDFAAYNRNIHCLFKPDQVDCSVYSYTFPSEPATCETYTQTFYVGNGDVTGDCEWRIISKNRVGDGEYKSENNACVLSENGTKVECWSQLTGKGFILTRDGVEKF